MNNQLKKGFLLWFLCMLGSLAVLPYLIFLKSESLTILQLLNFLIQNAIIYAIACSAGLYFTHKLGLIIVFDPHEKNCLKKLFLPALIGGLFVGGTILFFEFFMFSNQVNMISPPWYYGLLASFYGAINEEVLYRLFLFSFITWFLQKIFKSKSDIAYWISLIITALLFGIGHLPIAFGLGPITLFIVARILFLNGVGALVFGYLFWRYSLLTAMLAHFIADLIIHVLIFYFF